MSVLRLTFPGLSSQRNVYIGFSIYLITDFGGFCNDDSAYISLGSANVLTTVIFPCKVYLRCCHRLSTTSICFNFGSRFSLNIYIWNLIKLVLISMLSPSTSCYGINSASGICTRQYETIGVCLSVIYY